MTTKLKKQIEAQQRHGRQKYGRGPNDLAHDDRHSSADWFAMIDDHNERAFGTMPLEWREHLVKVAGLACSAVEAFDRKAKKQ